MQNNSTSSHIYHIIFLKEAWNLFRFSYQMNIK